MADLRPLASLSLTLVHYNPLDPISYFCAWLALVPQALCIVYVTLIWSTREIEILLMFIGQMACEAVNFALKRSLKEERPKQMHGKGYGMPSSHAQFVAFFSASLTLFLLFRHVPKPPSHSHTPLSLVSRIGLSALSLASAGLVAWSRAYLNYHTKKQIIVGFEGGLVFAISWFLLTVILRRNGHLEWLLEQNALRLFRMRDMVVEEDLCQAGWEKWESKKFANSASENSRKEPVIREKVDSGENRLSLK
ncbi:putative dolichyldiphosphatase [Golovinomyces cichoracearum]|uniref:Dolichyldiphosphatase n=1 Tax=Golovinomyces cichoracearum TaxID=62708 RepID=A0A420IL04_9PEZI|nr:putative dolichyldiphosphatase [Golovinomyces cichoracearum]